MKKITLSIVALLVSFQVVALEVGDVAPCVVLEGQYPDGSQWYGCIRDTEESSQKYTFLEFFSVTCKTCQGNIPVVSQLVEDLGERVLFRLVSVNEDVKAVKDYLSGEAKSHVNFQVAFDDWGMAQGAYHVEKAPVAYLLNQRNEVLWKHSGKLDDVAVDEITSIVSQ